MEITPIFFRTKILGVAARHTTEGWYSFFLNEFARGFGLGAKLVEMINERQVNVGVHRDCKVKQFYLDRGFDIIEERESEGLTILMPPCLRDDVIDAATLTIVCPSKRSVLVGLRNSESFRALWCNLGGKGFGPWLTGCREVQEECGVDLSHLPRPKDFTVHYTRFVNKNGEAVVYRVTNFIVEAPSEFAVTANEDEFDEVRWQPFDRLDELPRGHATRATHKIVIDRYR